MAADKPGEVDSGDFRFISKDLDAHADLVVGTQGKEYPTRFFARDYAGNLLEFST